MKKNIQVFIVIAMIMTLIIPSAMLNMTMAEEDNINASADTVTDGEASDLTSPDSSGMDNSASTGSENDEIQSRDAASDDDTGSDSDGATDTGDQQGSDDEDDFEYNEWQTEEDEYDTESTNTLKFIIEGADSLSAAFNSDFNTAEQDVDYSETIRNGDTKELLHGSTVRIKGISGSYIRAAYGETEEEARNNPDPEISDEGGSVSIGQDSDGFIYIRVSENKSDVVDENTNTATVADDEEGSIIYSDISNDDADAGKTQSAFPKKGQVFKGTATLKSYTLKTHNSIGYLVPTNGWLKENTTQKNIAAVCISGPTKAMANKGAKFNYIAKILEADPTTGKIRIGITFKPRSNKNNVSWGTVNNYHAGTQVLYKSMYIQLHAQTGYVTLKKSHAARNNNYVSSFPGNYTLAGARYRLYTDAGCTVQAKDIDGDAVEFITDARGNTGIAEVEPGTYYAKEVSASKGFKLDRNAHQITVTTDDSYSDPAVVTSAEEPVYAESALRLIKENDDFGYKRLIGTKYELSYYDTDPGDPVLSSTTLKAVWTYEARYMETAEGLKAAGIDFASDDPVSGTPYTEGGKKIIPLGVITVREIEAPKGLAVDQRVYMGTVTQNGDTAKVSVNGQDSLTVKYDDKLKHDEESKSVLLKLQKVDAETGRAEAEGTDREYSRGSLAGAVYEVFIEDTDLESDEKAGEIVTDENGYGELSTDSRTGDPLKPGRYYIKEIKASPGYVTDQFCEKDERNKYEEGQHIVLARADLDNGIMVYEYITASHEMHHETYISKTDITTGEELPGATLQVINSDGNIVEEWVSTESRHLIKALPDGEYTLREITAPYGYDISEDVTFKVVSDKVENTVTMKNSPVTIGTTALDKETSSHAGTFSENEIITDEVRLTGLYPGRQYKVTGTLVDKDSGNVIYTPDNSSDAADARKPVTAEKEFTAEAENMTIDLEFTVDSTEFSLYSVAVVYEKLMRISKVYETEEVPVELQKHENPNDEDQTIHYGGIIGTIAVDGNSRTHNVVAGRNAVIIDTVYYSNLSPRLEYRLEGELFDKTEGELTGIKVQQLFTPDTPDGTTEVEFAFDASGMEGHELVVFESLYARDKLINEHNDENNEAQTCRIVEEDSEGSSPKTSDDNHIFVYLTILALSLAEILIICRKNA